MGKVVKFPGGNGGQNKKQASISTSLEDKIKFAVEEHLTTNFAVKTVLGMDIFYRINEKGEIGVVGNVIYEHKRRGGRFMADFIASGYLNKKSGSVVISLLAFSAGEPDLYMNIYNTLKAKKILPVD